MRTVLLYAVFSLRGASAELGQHRTHLFSVVFIFGYSVLVMVLLLFSPETKSSFRLVKELPNFFLSSTSFLEMILLVALTRVKLQQPKLLLCVMD